jgi:transcription elongation factor Elf1
MSGETSANNHKPSLIHLHACIHCGQTRNREEIADHEINSGILHCPGCGMYGPLNVEIRKSATQ